MCLSGKCKSNTHSVMNTGPEEGPRKHKKADKQEERKFGRKATGLIKGGRKIKK